MSLNTGQRGIWCSELEQELHGSRQCIQWCPKAPQLSHKIRCRMIDACHRHRRAVFGVGCIPHVGRKKLRGTRTRWRTGFGDRTSNDTEAGCVFPYLKACRSWASDAQGHGVWILLIALRSCSAAFGEERNRQASWVTKSALISRATFRAVYSVKFAVRVSCLNSLMIKSSKAHRCTWRRIPLCARLWTMQSMAFHTGIWVQLQVWLLISAKCRGKSAPKEIRKEIGNAETRHAYDNT